MWHRDFYENGGKKIQKCQKLCWNLIFTLRMFHTLWINRTICHTLVCVKYTYDQLWDFNRYEFFSQMPNLRCVKNLHVFVTSVKNFASVTNTCEFFTRVTDSFECESQTNLSHVWKMWTYLSHMWRLFHRCDKYVLIPHLCEGLA